MNRAFRALGRRNVLIAVVGVVVIAAGSGVGIYLQSRAHRALPQSATRNVSAAPTAVPVGVTTVVEPKQAVTLTVVSTKPGNGSAAIPLESGITLAFNLAVNPAAVKSFLSRRFRPFSPNRSQLFLIFFTPQPMLLDGYRLSR